MKEFSMNRKPPVLLLSKAVAGFLQYKEAEGLSPRTIEVYTDHLERWLGYVGDVNITTVTTAQIRAFLVWLRTDYQSARIFGRGQPISSKTLRNYWVSLSALFTWAATEFGFPSPVKGVPAPKFEVAPVEPFTQAEVEKLLKAVEFMREANTDGREKFTMRRATAHRDRAIILMLLDTGLRVGELCALNIGDVEQKTGKVEVKHGVGGGAKGGKGRVVYLGKAARRSLWRYLAEREDAGELDAPLFLGRLDHKLDRDVLRQLIAGLGEKAGVKKCHPHRFRHTFAITYLRSGGDVFTLQSILGHSTHEMVQHYARIAQLDVVQAHRKASPADNWRL
jgi:integrase/recombinase XerD